MVFRRPPRVRRTAHCLLFSATKTDDRRFERVGVVEVVVFPVVSEDDDDM